MWQSSFEGMTYRDSSPLLCLNQQLVGGLVRIGPVGLGFPLPHPWTVLPSVRCPPPPLWFAQEQRVWMPLAPRLPWLVLYSMAKVKMVCTTAGRTHWHWTCMCIVVDGVWTDILLLPTKRICKPPPPSPARSGDMRTVSPNPH